jgi:hypothetical protein
MAHGVCWVLVLGVLWVLCGCAVLGVMPFLELWSFILEIFLCLRRAEPFNISPYRS